MRVVYFNDPATGYEWGTGYECQRNGCVCARVFARACVHAHMRVCVRTRAGVYAHVRVCMRDVFAIYDNIFDPG